MSEGLSISENVEQFVFVKREKKPIDNVRRTAPNLVYYAEFVIPP